MRSISLKRKLSCLAASALLCMTSMDLSGLAEEKTTPPSWVPLTYERAQEFNERYGITRTAEGLICIVKPEQAAIDLYYKLTDTDSNKNELLYHERFKSQGLQTAYEVWLYKPEASTTSTFRLEYGGGIAGAVIDSFDYTFVTDKDGNVSETDIYSWVPDSVYEYKKYINDNPNLSLHDNCLVYWDSVCYDGGYTLEAQQDGEGSFTKIIDDNFYQTHNKEGEVPDPGDWGGDIFQVYKPEKTGEVTITFTNAQQPPNFSKVSEDAKIITKKYNIMPDESIAEIDLDETFDWVPKKVSEYEKYLETHERISANGEYIIYSGSRSPWSTLGEGFDESKLRKLDDEWLESDTYNGLTDTPAYRFIVYGKTDSLKAGDTVDISWWAELGDERYIDAIKTFRYTDKGFESVMLAGDADNGGTVDPYDIKYMGNYLTKRNKYGVRESIVSFENSDMNGDGQINVIDYLILKRQVVKDHTVPVQNDKTVELTADITPFSVQSAKPTDTFENSQISFALSLLQNTVDSKENVLVSPYSVSQALAMTANGADNNTLKELMKVIGGGMDIDTFNEQMASYRIGQPNEEKCRLLTANSIWCTDNTDLFTADKDFLLKNKSYYDARIFSTPFDANSVKDVNNWVEKHTDGMIPEIIKEFDKNTVMALVNAVTFDAKWAEPYEKAQNGAGFFSSADGKKQDAQVLVETNMMPYFEDKEAKGFMKLYEGGRYAFASILPNEGISIDKYVSGLTSDKLSGLFKSAEDGLTVTMMPKFSTDYGESLAEILKTMGIKDAFSAANADFSKMGRALYGNVWIDDVIHKTHIDVDEEGTRAAAATAVVMKGGAAMNMNEVILDRPFVYAIIDTGTNIPIFIGTLLTLEN